jgi:RHS repeat-associated protein
LGTSETDSSKLKLDYTYGVMNQGNLDLTKNNGNVESQTITLPEFVLKQSYNYDSLNRLDWAEEKQGSTQIWKQDFTYDRWGNRTVDLNETVGVPELGFEVETAKNRLLAPGDLPLSPSNRKMRYDAAGNLVNDSWSSYGSSSPGISTRTYDAANRMLTAQDSTGGTTIYSYDGDGRRVKKVTAGVTTIFVYNAFGELIAEYPNSAPTEVAATSYLTTDHLGTPRVITRGDGTVISRRDYLPFGEETSTVGPRLNVSTYGAPDSVRHQFTQKERDNETGLDYFGARYYASTQGRFTSADPLLSSGIIYDPQSWNRYGYASNNPLSYTDPFGLFVYDPNATKDQRKKFEEGLKKAQKALKKLDPKSVEYKDLERAIKALGAVGVDNGVTVAFGSNNTGSPAATVVGISDRNADGMKDVSVTNPTGQNTVVTFDTSQHSSAADYAVSIGHEGSHVADAADVVGALPVNLTNPAAAAVLAGPLNLTKYATETRAYGVSAAVARGLGYDTLKIGPKGGNQYEVWNSGWKQADRATKQAAGIDRVLAEPKSKKGLYEVTPANPGKRLIE